MKLIIAGSRSINDFRQGTNIHYLLQDFGIYNDIKEIVSGGCLKGPDLWAKEYVQEENECLRDCDKWIYTEFPADWNKHKKAAGPIRNKEMAEYSDVLLLIWDGESKGSRNMKNEMVKLNKPVYEVIIKSPKIEDSDDI